MDLRRPHHMEGTHLSIIRTFGIRWPLNPPPGASIHRHLQRRGGGRNRAPIRSTDNNLRRLSEEIQAQLALTFNSFLLEMDKRINSNQNLFKIGGNPDGISRDDDFLSHSDLFPVESLP